MERDIPYKFEATNTALETNKNAAKYFNHFSYEAWISSI